MKIEKIELNGFKSFSEKTTFNLHSGITCIVGPNGCGKSNVVDAFRWVLGEQSAKTLRGEKMEEVIFNGSAARKPKGMAEVTLFLSGLGGIAGGNGNGDDKIVTVSRRLYRSGESEYLINKNTCRLKDIKDLFLDTGLEVKSYSIIEQGRIGDILNSKPQERRFLIEEVAGVMKYKVRKAEAQSKLESSRLNLQRITDIVAEVKKQISTLDRLAKKAERYKALADELKTIDLKVNKKEYSQFDESLAVATQDHARNREQESALRAALSTIETDYQRERLEMVQKEKELNVLLEEFQGIERLVTDIQKQVAVQTSESASARQHADRIRSQITELEQKIAGLGERLAVLEQERESLTNQLETYTISVSEKRDFISGVEQEIHDIESSIEEKRRDIFRITETLSALTNDLARVQSAIESMAKKESGYFKEIEEIAAAMDTIETNIRSTDAAIVNKNSDLSMLREQRETLTRTTGETRETIEHIRGTISSLKEELASDSSRLASLQEITSESLSPEIMGQAEKLHVIGALSDIVSVDAQYEKAIEAILSDKLSGYLVSSLSDIESAVGFIRERALARTAFMIPGNFPPGEDASPVHEAVIGRAIDFVKTEEQYLPVIRRLLDRVFIIRDIQSAFRLKEQERDLIFITPAGDVIDASSTVFSGEGKEILKRKREIRELEGKRTSKQSLIQSREQELASLQNALVKTEADVAAVGERIITIEKETSIHRIELQNLHHEKERLQRKRANIKIEIDQSQREKEDLTRRISDLQATITTNSAKRNEIEQSLSAQQQVLAEKKVFYEQHRSELTDIKLEMTSYREKIDSSLREIQAVQDSSEEARTKIEELKQELGLTIQREQDTMSSIAGLEEQIKTRVIAIDEKRGEISGKREAIEVMSSVLAEQEKQVRVVREQIEETTAHLSSSEVAKTEYRLKMESIFSHILQMYGVNIDLLETEEPTAEDLEKLPSLREKIQSIGPVNLGTIEEYEELKNRHEFLTAQQEDLTKSIDELEQAIRKINATTRKRLSDAFLELNAKFGEVFKHLFGGGRAELTLTDEQNILESGIDIIAQPPGKRLQNISLLSGGEKALTAIALVFAGFLIKPAPICILDEADAPLDDSNTDRFALLVKDLASSTQFIVITHNRTTMESADYIYGITMEEPGTSKVISMQLTEA